MATLFILIGPPGIGKTLYCCRHMGSRDVRVSMDDLQQMMGGDRYGNYRPGLKDIYRTTETHVVREALMAGHDVWLDRTNMDRKRRQRYVRTAQSVAGTILTAVNFMAFNRPNDSWLLHRRMRDDRGVPKEKWNEVISNMIENYEPPRRDEGFNQIIDVGLEEVTE